MKSKGIILIHGAGLGSFIWDEVKPRLGLPALAVDFPNRNHGHKANSKLRFNDYSNTVIQQIGVWGVKDMIIVAHSIGGCLGLKIADYYGSRVKGFIAIGAGIPSNGDSFVSCLPFPQKVVIPLLLKFAGTRPPSGAIEKGLCNHLNPRQTKKVVEDFTPESKYLYTEKCNAGIPSATRVYIKLSDDKEFPLSVQNRMAENLQAHHTLSIHTGHLPMMSHPKELAETLNEFVSRG